MFCDDLHGNDGGKSALRHVSQQDGIGCVEIEPHLVFVEDIDRLHRLPFGWITARIRVFQPHVTILHVLGGHLPAIVEFDSLAKIEDDGGIRRSLPGSGQRLYDLALGIIADEALVHVLVKGKRGKRSRLVRIPTFGIGAQGYRNRPPCLDRQRRTARPNQHRCDHCRYDEMDRVHSRRLPIRTLARHGTPPATR